MLQITCMPLLLIQIPPHLDFILQVLGFRFLQLCQGDSQRSPGYAFASVEQLLPLSSSF